MYPQKSKKNKNHGIHNINLINCTVRKIRRGGKEKETGRFILHVLFLCSSYHALYNYKKTKKTRDKRSRRLRSLDRHLRWCLLPITGLGIVISSRIVLLVLLARRVDSLLLF